MTWEDPEEVLKKSKSRKSPDVDNMCRTSQIWWPVCKRIITINKIWRSMKYVRNGKLNSSKHS
jgi:hypothetical protein